VLLELVRLMAPLLLCAKEMVRVRSLVGSVLAAALLAACGGSVAIGPAGAGGEAAGGAAASGAGGGAAAGGPSTDCVYLGVSHTQGMSFPAGDGCNTCSCQAGSVSCTLRACAITCQSNGQVYQPGQTFNVDCNTCTCQADGSISCTGIACFNQCSALQSEYADALKRAKACTPGQPDQCQASVSSVVSCGCSTPVNASNTEAVAELSALQKQADAVSCISPCPPCVAPGPATCTAAGSCEEAPLRAVSCKVGGVVYPSGTSGIPDPTSCNKCSCDNGTLNCTLAACPIDCPPNTKYGTQCAMCGPTDACLTIEHGCLPVCTPDCQGLCTDGICRSLVCG